MAEALREGPDNPARALARAAETIHAITYYSPEVVDLTDEGYRGWWHAYFAYRPAPMGAVNAGTVVAAFYNFAPRMVERALPSVWEIRSPAETVAMRIRRVAQVTGRLAGSDAPTDAATEVVDLLRRATDGLSPAGRPVFAANAALDWPDDPLLAVWHGCTLIREHRGDGHNISLAAAGVDGVECHVLMSGRGHGNRATILGIRGWTEDEWAAAVERLAARGWVEPDGTLTDAGRRARSAIEADTDVLAGGPLARLGTDGLDRLLAGLGPLADHLVATGEVSGRWPPPTVTRPDDAASAGSSP